YLIMVVLTQMLQFAKKPACSKNLVFEQGVDPANQPLQLCQSPGPYERDEIKESMKLGQQQLEAHLWGAANILRGKTAGQDYKNYILSLMFYKRLCDQWEC